MCPIFARSSPLILIKIFIFDYLTLLHKVDILQSEIIEADTSHIRVHSTDIVIILLCNNDGNQKDPFTLYLDIDALNR